MYYMLTQVTFIMGTLFSKTNKQIKFRAVLLFYIFINLSKLWLHRKSWNISFCLQSVVICYLLLPYVCFKYKREPSLAQMCSWRRKDISDPWKGLEDHTMRITAVIRSSGSRSVPWYLKAPIMKLSIKHFIQPHIAEVYQRLWGVHLSVDPLL